MWKNGNPGEAAILFTLSDRHEGARDVGAGDGGPFGELAELPVCEYHSAAPVLAQRLDSLGYTLEVGREAYATGVEEAIESEVRVTARLGPELAEPRLPDIYRELTFGAWMEMAGRRGDLSQFGGLENGGRRDPLRWIRGRVST